MRVDRTGALGWQHLMRHGAVACPDGLAKETILVFRWVRAPRKSACFGSATRERPFVARWKPPPGPSAKRAGLRVIGAVDGMRVAIGFAEVTVLAGRREAARAVVDTAPIDGDGHLGFVDQERRNRSGSADLDHLAGARALVLERRPRRLLRSRQGKPAGHEHKYADNDAERTECHRR